MVLRHKPLTAGQHTSKQHEENKYDSVHIYKKMLLYLSKNRCKGIAFLPHIQLFAANSLLLGIRLRSPTTLSYPDPLKTGILHHALAYINII